MLKTKGFGLTGIIVAIGCLLLIGVMIWKVLETTRVKTPANTPPTASKIAPISLVGGRVTFNLPKAWSVQFADDTEKFVGSTATPADGTNRVTITPSSNALNSYNEPFIILASVYQDTNGGESTRDWFEKTLTSSMAADTDKTSTEKINGYDTYVFEQINKNYQEYNYVLRHNGLLVYVKWRPSETHYNPDHEIDQRIDNTRYNSDILKMINSIAIK